MPMKDIFLTLHNRIFTLLQAEIISETQTSDAVSSRKVRRYTHEVPLTRLYKYELNIKNSNGHVKVSRRISVKP